MKKNEIVDMSSSDESLCEDDPSTPSPLKYVEANTLLSSLPLKAKDILSTITTSKKLVKYVKLVSDMLHTVKTLVSLTTKLSFL